MTEDEFSRDAMANDSHFGGRMPTSAGDLSLETHGIAPIPASNRYGSARRLFTVWFAPNMNMTALFIGSLAVVLGLGFWWGLLAIVIGTSIGSAAVAWMSVWGPKTGTSQLQLSRMAFGNFVILPGLLQWLSSIAWDALVGIFGGEALALLLGIPFPIAVVILLGLQCLVGVLGYEVIHRVEAVMSVVLAVTFGVMAYRLLSGHDLVTPATVTGADLVAMFILMVTISLSLAISWASYASDFARYLPVQTPSRSIFWNCFLGLFVSYAFVQALGAGAADLIKAQSAQGVRDLMGGGFVGVLALLAISLGSVASNAMNDYSGSLALQTIGIRVARPVGAVVVTIAAFALIMWLHSGDLATNFTNLLLFVGYWLPGFVAVTSVDWLLRIQGRASFDPRKELTLRRDAIWATLSLVLAFVISLPFMATEIYTGPIATSWHGADTGYFVGFIAGLVLYGGYRVTTRRAEGRVVQRESEPA